MYYALFHSHFIYCIHIWSSTTLSNLNGLFVKQKMAVRILNSAKYNAHSEPLYKQSNILPLPSHVEYFKLQFFHNFILDEPPRSFTNTWTRNIDRRHEDQAVLRNHLEFFIPPTRLASTDKFPLANFPQLWCSFPDERIKAIVNKSSFNINLKKHFLDKLSSNYVCSRLLCPHCHLRV